MKFDLDTKNSEDVKLIFSSIDYDGDLSVLISDFCFGLATFIVALAIKLNCDTEQTLGLKEVCLSCIGRNVDNIIEQSNLKDNRDDGIPKEELIFFEERMRNKGFSEPDITACIHFLKDAGDWGVALRYLESIIRKLDAQT